MVPARPRAKSGLARRLAVAAVAALAAQAPAAVEPLVVTEEAFPCVGLRSAPDLESPAIDCLAPGIRVTPLSEQEGWRQVALADGRQGWAPEQLFAPESEEELRQARAVIAANQELRARLSSRLAASEQERRELARQLQEARARLARLEGEPAAGRGESSESREVGAEEPAGREGEPLVVTAAADPCVNVRAEATVEGRRLGCLAPGARVMQVAQAAGWRQVVLEDGRQGWAAEGYFREETGDELRQTRTALAITRKLRVELSERLEASEQKRDELVRQLTEARAQLTRLEGRLEEAREEPSVPAPADEALVARIEELTRERDELRERAVAAEEAREPPASRPSPADAEPADRARLRLALAELRGQSLVVTAAADPCVQLRSAPSLEGRSLDCLAPGVRVTLVELAEGWRRVALADGRQGWTADGFLEAESRGELRRTRAALTAAQEARAELASRLMASEQARADLGRRLEESGTRAAALDSELAGVREELVESREGARGLSARVEALGGEGEELRRRAVAAEGARDDLAGELEELREELARAVAQGSAEREELEARLRETQAAAEAAAQELTARLAASEEERSGLTSRLSASEQARADLGRRLEESGTRADGEPAGPTGATPAPTTPGEAAAAAQRAAQRARRRAAVVRVVEQWSRAWAAQRVDEYLSFYARDFTPAGGLSRSGWEAERRRRVRAPSFIEVELGPISVEVAGDRASAHFIQRYRSDDYSDEVGKLLWLAWREGGWKIIEERSE